MRSKFEIRAQKLLEAEGWHVDWKAKPRRTPVGYSVDYWNIWDLLAHQDYIIRGIAIKGQGGVPQALRKAIEDFKACDHFVKEIWTFRQPTHKAKRVKNAPYVIRKEIIE
jgi:hypothetical protein